MSLDIECPGKAYVLSNVNHIVLGDHYWIFANRVCICPSSRRDSLLLTLYYGRINQVLMDNVLDMVIMNLCLDLADPCLGHRPRLYMSTTCLMSVKNK